jgi:GNAT superfamily N-acetyltransferase
VEAVPLIAAAVSDRRGEAPGSAAGSVWRAGGCTEGRLRAHHGFAPGGYVGAVKVRPRQAADQAAAREFLARHSSLRVARLGELIHPLDHPAFVAVAAGGQLLGMLTYVPGQDGQCEILTLHAHEQWHGAGTALIEAVGQLARRQGCTRRSRCAMRSSAKSNRKH